MTNKTIDLKELLLKRTEDMEPDGNVKEAVAAAEHLIPKNLMYEAESIEFKPETKPVRSSVLRTLSVDEAKEREDEMNRFIEEVLISGVDFGIVPHTSKPTLLKPGAEKILNFLGLVARTVIVNRVEDIQTGYFAYEAKVYVIDADGIVRGEGVGITNSKEGKYAKSTGFAVQNTVLKMAKKRAFVDVALNVGSLSARFTQDVEDLPLDPNVPFGKKPESLSGKSKEHTARPATQKQIAYLERLMAEHNTSVAALNKYTKEHWGVDDFHKLNGLQASELINKFQSAAG